MAKYLKLFETTSQYNTYINGTPDLPNVSLCEDNNGVHYTRLVPVTGVTLNKQSAQIQINSTTTLTATVAPNDASDKSVTWMSSDTTKVTISGSGASVTLNGVAVGSSTITCASASDPTKTATCTVTVTPIPVTGITLSPSSLSMNQGETATVTATVTPSTASNKNVTWSTSDRNVASISQNGSSVTVTAVGGGTATITCASVSNPSVTAACTATVTGATVDTNMYVRGTLLTSPQQSPQEDATLVGDLDSGEELYYGEVTTTLQPYNNGQYYFNIAVMCDYLKDVTFDKCFIDNSENIYKILDTTKGGWEGLSSLIEPIFDSSTERKDTNNNSYSPKQYIYGLTEIELTDPTKPAMIVIGWQYDQWNFIYITVNFNAL